MKNVIEFKEKIECHASSATFKKGTESYGSLLAALIHSIKCNIIKYDTGLLNSRTGE